MGSAIVSAGLAGLAACASAEVTTDGGPTDARRDAASRDGPEADGPAIDAAMIDARAIDAPAGPPTGWSTSTSWSPARRARPTS